MRRPPRLIERTLIATFLTVALILLVTFVVLTLDIRERVRMAESEKLQVSTNVFTAFEAKRQHDQLRTVGTLTEAPTLKAALETYASESRFGGVDPEQAQQLHRTVTNEIEKLADRTGADALVIVGTDGHVVAAAGPYGDAWDIGHAVAVAPDDTFQQVTVLPAGTFRVSGARLRIADDQPGLDQSMGQLLLATRLDANYAQELSDLADAGIVIVVNQAVVARTVSEPVARAVARLGRDDGRTAWVNGEEHAIGRVLDSGGVRILMLSSIDAAARTATRTALTSLLTVAVGSIALALVASVWVARTLARPIDRLAGEIATMTAARDFERTIPAPGTSREVDSLANTFNHLVRSLSAAESETRTTYLGAVQALAAALDARDPYTAGHSERVSTLSVLVAQQMTLPDTQVDIIRLGALLHDVGKIGVPDEILRKPGPLTAAEFEHIKQHPTLGARILRQVPFLRPHLPIVELHHERPDGRGYPFGLRGHDIPLEARIVHVADAFDAMTSARAYRPPLAPDAALAELERHAGTEFDPAVVAAIAATVASAPPLSAMQYSEVLGRAV